MQFKEVKHQVDQGLNKTLKNVSSLVGDSVLSLDDKFQVETIVEDELLPLWPTLKADDEMDIDKDRLETPHSKYLEGTAFRLQIFDMIKKLEKEGNSTSFDSLYLLLDTCLACCDKNMVPPTLPLSLIEEIFDSLSIAQCEKFFDYLEFRADRLTSGMVSGQGKGLIILRLCNELLKRLSKTKNIVFSGRILMYLATVYPLSERSGVNVRGDYNLDNVTRFEGDDDEQALTEVIEKHKDTPWEPESDDENFYKAFWNMQKYFSNPNSLFPGNFDKLQVALGATLSVFDKINAETTPNMTSSRLAKKRKGKTVQEAAANIAKEPFFPKYLTSTTLFPMELRDPLFRRQVLVQALILLQYLSLLTSSERDRLQEYTTKISEPGRARPASVYGSVPTLNGKQEQWVEETRPKILNALEKIPPNGKQFLKTISYIMGHEKNWIQWKNEGCASIERSGLDYDLQMKTKKRKADRLPDFLLKRSDRNGMVKDSLAILTEADEDEMTVFANSDNAVPTLTALLEPLEHQIKSGEYEKDERLSQDPMYQWKAIRLASKTHLHVMHHKDAPRKKEDGQKPTAPPNPLQALDVERLVEALMVERGESWPQETVQNAEASKETTEAVQEEVKEEVKEVAV